MADLPEEAVAAVKLTRADAVKLVADQLAADCAGDVTAAEAAVAEARDLFRVWAVRVAVNSTNGGLDAVQAMVGSATLPMSWRCLYQLNEGEDGGSTASVVFSDNQKTYDARYHAMIDVEIVGEGVQLRDAWARALTTLRTAQERDLRVGAMKKDARDALMKAALSGTAEGEAVVAAIKALSAALKVKV